MTMPHLERRLNTLQAAALNVTNMLGAGPFITIPLLLATMGGPQAMLGWLVAMVVVMCDALIWAELGAALPGSGGTYHYFREIFRGSEWGRLLPFLFIWQFLVSGTLEVASGYIAAADFALSLSPTAAASDLPLKQILTTLMVGVMFLALCQPIRSLGWLGTALAVGALAAAGTIIVSGALHFDSSLVLPLAPDAFQLDQGFFLGLGAAMSIAVYDYLGYYNICYLGEEVREPHKTIPRAVLLSIVVVAAIYMAMNLAFMGVVPWREAIDPTNPAYTNISKAFMTKLYGEGVARGFTLLIIWTCLAGLFAITLGYSRIVYAAAQNGDFFAPFAALHPTRGYPRRALAMLSVLTAIFCLVPLEIVIAGAVTVRIVVQFIGQIFAVHALRRQPGRDLPFRTWLYPLPSAVALAGWTFLLAASERRLLALLVVVYGAGLLAFILRDRIAPPDRMTSA